MNKNYECPNCGYDIGHNEKECKYCGTKNPNYIGPARGFLESARDSLIPQANSNNGVISSSKSRIACGLLQIFFGGLGIGRFYSGHTNIAVAQILVTVFSCGWGGIWGFIDGILILCNSDFKDADGNIMR